MFPIKSKYPRLRAAAAAILVLGLLGLVLAHRVRQAQRDLRERLGLTIDLVGAAEIAVMKSRTSDHIGNNVKTHIDSDNWVYSTIVDMGGEKGAPRTKLVALKLFCRGNWWSIGPIEIEDEGGSENAGVVQKLKDALDLRHVPHIERNMPPSPNSHVSQ